jgi:hypothetical protein
LQIGGKGVEDSHWVLVSLWESIRFQGSDRNSLISWNKSRLACVGGLKNIGIFRMFALDSPAIKLSRR